MRRTALLLALAATLPAFAADPQAVSPERKAMMDAHQRAGTPGEPHRYLLGTVGEYDLLIKSWHEPGGEPATETGRAFRRMIHRDRVLQEEVASQMGDTPWTGFGLHGYDNVTGKYWATWTDSLSTGLMVSEGSCDAKHACRFTGTFNDPVSGKPQTARMTSRWTTPDTQVYEMYAPGPDGKEAKMMEITYRKK